MKLTTYGLSDIGVGRSNNEDVWIASVEFSFFALADGMGGHKAGEVAAREAITHLFQSIQEIQTTDCLEWMIELKYAIEKANQTVYHLSKNEEAFSGMGTTLCCIAWLDNAVIYAHVGDSRIYLFRNNQLQLLTQDHSLFAKWLKTGKESQTPFPYKNVITRAVGTAPKAFPEISMCRPEPEDLFLLCSDGLSDVLSTDEIEKILIASESLEIGGKRLIKQAKIKGSCDNITLLMVQAEKISEKSLSRQQRDKSSRRPSLSGDASGLTSHSSEPV